MTEAELLVEALLEDLTGRSGFGRWWEEVRQDVKTEIRTTWVQIIEERR